MYLNDILIGETLVGFVVLCVLEEDFVHVCGRVLVQFVAGGKDDEGDLAVAQNRQLVRFLHHAKLSFVESYL